MGLNIIYSVIAKRDLHEIYSFIKKDSVYYAKKEIEDIRSAVRKLKSNSYLGKKFERADDELTLELIFKNYRIIYDIVSDTRIVILSVHHHARNLSNNSAFSSED